MLSKSLIQFSVDGQGCVPSLLFSWGQTMVDFPGDSDGKVSAYDAGDPGSIPGSGRSPGKGNGNPFQYSCLEKPTDRGAWWAIVYGITKSRTQLSDFTFTLNYGGGNEDDGYLLQKVPCTAALRSPTPQQPPPTHASAGDSWTLTGKSGSVSCGVTARFSWFLVHTSFCLCPPRVCFSSPL